MKESRNLCKRNYKMSKTNQKAFEYVRLELNKCRQDLTNLSHQQVRARVCQKKTTCNMTS